MVVTLFWTVLGLAGALPLYISPQPDIGATRRDLRGGVGPHHDRATC